MFGFYRFAVFLCKFFSRLYFKFIVNGLDNIENFVGGGVLISNHISYLDPIVLGIFFKKRKLYFMAKKELFSVPLFRIIIKKLGAFPVDRKKNSSFAIDMAVDMVRNGKLVAMFPQGHRCNVLSLPPKTGFIRIALSSKCKIIPCSIRYDGFLPRSKVYLNFAKPVDISEEFLQDKKERLDYKYIKNIALKVWEKIIRLYY